MRAVDVTDLPGWLVDVPLAHRGLHDLDDGRPENSLAAFRAAAGAGVGVELDVRLSADGVPMVAHDMDLAHSTGQSVRVSALSARDLARLPLFGTSETMPSLAAALDVLADVPVMVEVKNETARAGRLEAATAALVRAHAGPVSIASFNPRTVAWFARHAPTVLRGQTGSSANGVPRAVRPLLRRLHLTEHGRPHYWSWNVADLADPRIIAARSLGQPVYAWTVRTREDLALARAGADNVIFERLDPTEVGVTRARS